MIYYLLYSFLFIIIFCVPSFAATSDLAERSDIAAMPHRMMTLTQPCEPKPQCVRPHRHEHFSIFGDFLYFKPVADSLQSTQKVPQEVPNFKPKTVVLDQDFDFGPGMRLGAILHIPYGEWDLAASWTRFYSSNESFHACEPDFGLLATLALPVYAASGNALVEHVNSRWHLKLNAFDLNFSRNIVFNPHFSIRPIGGVKGAIIDQSMRVHYHDFLIQFATVTTPHKVFAKNPYWGVGPLVGGEMRFLLPARFAIFFNGSLAALMGDFSIKTVYTDFTNTPKNAKLTIKDSPIRVSVFEQLQAGIDKKFAFRKWSIDLGVGWEVQVWRNQMRMDWFKGFIETPQGADLTLYGLFVRGMITF